VELAVGLARTWEEIGHGHWADAEALYEAAAMSSKDPSIAIRGADLAWSRSHGRRSVALFELAAELAVAADDPASEAYATSGIVEISTRFGCYVGERARPEAEAPLVERCAAAADAAGDDASRCRARLAGMWLAHRDDELGMEQVEASVSSTLAMARLHGDMVVLSSALDGSCSEALRNLRVGEASKMIEERLRITEAFDPRQARQFMERLDALFMASEVCSLTGAFENALEWGRQLDRLGRGRGFIYGGLAQLAQASFFLGRFDECLQQCSGALGDVLQRPSSHALMVWAYCCAGAICGYRGDDRGAARWFAQAEELAGVVPNKSFFIRLMKADVHLHHGRREAAAELLAAPPSSSTSPWRGWYAAARAEALGPSAFAEAEEATEVGEYSAAVLARAQGRLEEALCLFNKCGAAYQAARTALRMGPTLREDALATYGRLGLASC